MSLAVGRYFTEEEMNNKVKVAVLGSSLATELFGDTPPSGSPLLSEHPPDSHRRLQ